MEISRPRRSTRNRRKNKSPAEESSQTSINDLPEVLLLHILSFLPTIDAIRISVVAPPWRNLWESLPNLDFDMHYFQRQIPDKSNRLSRILFAEFVRQALRRVLYDSAFQKFKLLFNYKDCGHIRAYVDGWIYMLVNFLKPVEIDCNFVEHGVLGDYDDDEGDDVHYPDAPYEFPIHEIASSSIEVLKLRTCGLHFPTNTQPVTLHSIKKVHLNDFQGYAGEVERLIGSCVNLDTFVLEHCGGCSEFNIVSGSLKHLTLGVTQGYCNTTRYLEICAPRLESIEIDELTSSNGVAYNLTHTSSLNEATVRARDFSTRLSQYWTWWDFACWVNLISFFTGVMRLTIHLIPQDEYEHGSKRPPSEFLPQNPDERLIEVKVFGDISAFRNLIYLTLKMGYLKEDIRSLGVFLNKCPVLETLVLVWNNFSHGRGSMTKEKEMEMTDDSLVVSLQIPRLRVVKMEGYLGTKNEQYVVDLLKKHGVVLEKIVAFPAKVKVGEKEISPPSFLL